MNSPEFLLKVIRNRLDLEKKAREHGFQVLENTPLNKIIDRQTKVRSLVSLGKV